MSDQDFSRSLNSIPEETPSLAGSVEDSRPPRPRRSPKSKDAAPKNQKKVQINISLDEDIAMQLRLASLVEDRPISEIVQNCLRSSKIKLPVYEVTKRAG